MKKLSGLLFGLTVLLFGGLAHANMLDEIEIDNPLHIPPAVDASVRFAEGAGILGFYDPQYGTDLYVLFQGLELSDGFSTAWSNSLVDGVTPNQLGDQVKFLEAMVAKLDDPKLGAVNINAQKVNVEGTTFTTSQEYFWIKRGNYFAFFWNPNPGTALVITTDGYSYYGVAGVPIPAAFVLFGSGLLGLGWLARRQRARKEESVA